MIYLIIGIVVIVLAILLTLGDLIFDLGKYVSLICFVVCTLTLFTSFILCYNSNSEAKRIIHNEVELYVDENCRHQFLIDSTAIKIGEKYEIKCPECGSTVIKQKELFKNFKKKIRPGA